MRQIAFILIFFLPAFSKAQQDKPLLIHHVTVVNVVDGSLRRDAAILIADQKIKAIGTFEELKSQASKENQVDGGGKYIIPGLWDMHVHLEGQELVEDNQLLLPVFLAYGITTIRDCASDLGEQVLEWRNEINAGKRVGPRIFTAGRKLEGKKPIWKRDLEIENEQELAQSLDLLDQYKVDFVKITENTLAGDLFLKSVAAAHQRGYKVSGHVPVDLTIAELVSAGYTSVEHASYLLRLGNDEAGIVAALKSKSIAPADANARYGQSFDQQRALQGYTALGKAGLFVCPTLIGGRELAYLDVTDHSKDKALGYLTEKFTANYAWRIQRQSGDTPEQRQQRKERYVFLRAQLPFMQMAGITLMAGSDAAALNTYVYPAESLIQELEIFKEAGLTPLQILQSATLSGPKYFGIQDQVGTVEVGKRADLVLLAENPLQNISAFRGIEGVLTNGKYYDRAALANMMEAAKQKKQQLDISRKK